jgi:hypothetical protein
MNNKEKEKAKKRTLTKEEKVSSWSLGLKDLCGRIYKDNLKYFISRPHYKDRSV